MQGVDSTTRPVMAPISISTAGDNVIVPGDVSQYIYVRQILLTTPGGAQTIEFKEGPSTVLSNFELNANDGLVLENTSFDYPFLFDVKPGQDLIINLSAGTSVLGHIVYGFRK